MVDMDNWMVVSLAMASSSRLRSELEHIDSAMGAQREHQLMKCNFNSITRIHFDSDVLHGN